MTTRADILKQYETDFIEHMKTSVNDWLSMYCEPTDEVISSHLVRLNMLGMTWHGDHILTKQTLVSNFYALDVA